MKKGSDMKKIAIVGSQASGKSFLADRLGEMLQLPVIHLDELFWRWRAENLTAEERNARVVSLTEAEEWIIDGNFIRSLDARVAASDAVILLDLPRWLCAWRLLKRRSRLINVPRQKLAPYQRNTWPMLKAIWAFPQQMKPRLEAIIQPHSVHKIVLRSHREVTQLLPEIDEQP